MKDQDQNIIRAKLQNWLKTQWPESGDVEVAAIRFPREAGNSAETSFAEASYKQNGQTHRRRLVVRRQIEGYDIFLDPDLNLQFQMMKTMANHPSVPVPPVVGIEFDRSIFGSPFLVMDAVEGKVVAQNPNYNEKGWLADLAQEKRATVWFNAIDAMAKVHQIDWRDGFSFLDKPERGKAGLDQYINALELWYRWAANGRKIPILETTMAYLRDRQPANMPVTVLWGDSHVSNILFRDDLSVAAILDWEAAAIGTPEVDFGYWIFFDELYSRGAGVARLAGLPSRDDMIARYEKALGRETRDLPYFEVLGAMRFAICMVRFADRMVALGRIPPSSTAGAQNPATMILAEKLKLSTPVDMTDFIAMTTATYQ